jgi:integrase/recombinase XerD
MAVNLVKYVKDGAKWKFVPVQFYSNGRIKHDSRPGTFYLDWREGKKRKHKAIGSDASMALAEYQKHQHRLALGLDTKGEETTPTHSLQEAIDSFLAEKKLHAAKSTYAGFCTALKYFRASCGKNTLESLTREDILAFHHYLRQQGLSDRTVYNKHRLLIAFLRAHGIDNLLRRGDQPVFVEEEPEVYDKKILDTFFAACSPEEWLIFQFFLCTGMREQEVTHTYIKDLDFESSTVRVSAKSDYNWRPKKNKGREIPIPSRLLEPLRQHVLSRKDDCPLLFPTSGCKPHEDFWEVCQNVADRAGLDVEMFWLHKFRATFATWALQGGVDLATVQHWMGHTDLASTMRYLRPARGESVKRKVDTIFS